MMNGKRKRKMLDVKTAREKLGMTQKQLAQELEVSERIVQCWEAGTVQPSKVTLFYVNHLVTMANTAGSIPTHSGETL